MKKGSKKPEQTCCMIDCDRKDVIGRGLCKTHYSRFRNKVLQGKITWLEIYWEGYMINLTKEEMNTLEFSTKARRSLALIQRFRNNFKGIRYKIPDNEWNEISRVARLAAIDLGMMMPH